MIHILMARKPLDKKSVAGNVIEHKTGGINIGKSRIGNKKRLNAQKSGENLNKLSRPNGNDSIDAKGLGAYGIGVKQVTVGYKEVQGRFPANILFDENSSKILDKQSGVHKSGDYKGDGCKEGGWWRKSTGKPISREYGDEGGASRFFKVIK